MFSRRMLINQFFRKLIKWINLENLKREKVYLSTKCGLSSKIIDELNKFFRFGITLYNVEHAGVLIRCVIRFTSCPIPFPPPLCVLSSSWLKSGKMEKLILHLISGWSRLEGDHSTQSQRTVLSEICHPSWPGLVTRRCMFNLLFSTSKKDKWKQCQR